MDPAASASPAPDVRPGPDGDAHGAQHVRLCMGGLPDRAASNFAAVIARAAGAPTVLIQLLDDRQQLRLFGASGVPAGWAQIGRTPAASTLAALVISHEHPIISTDIADDPRVPPDAPARALGVHGYAGFPIRDEQQRIVGVCTVVDFVARDWSSGELTAIDQGAQACTAFVAERQARDRVETQRCFLDALLQSLRTGVAACDERGRLVLVNEVIRVWAGALPIGVPLEEWTRHSRVTDVAGRPVAPWDLPLLRALRGEHLRDLDVTMSSPDGPSRILSTDAQPIADADGRRLGAVVTCRDVTDQRRAERFRDIERRVLDALAHADRSPQIGSRVLAAICSGLGWRYAELWLTDRDADALILGSRHDADDAVDADARPSPDVLTEAAWRTGRPVWSGPAEPPGPRICLSVPAVSDGKVLALLSFAATRPDEAADHLIHLLSGIGSHIAEFLERRRADELALALAHSKDDYLALIGHELRTPLTSIAAYIAMISEADPGTVAEDLPEMLDVLSRNSATLRHIVDQLLDLAALSRRHPGLAQDPVDLAATVRSAVEEARPAADAAGVTVAFRLGTATPALGDPARLRQLTGLLLDNAVKHTMAGGDVTVELTQPAGAILELAVTDNGIGVPDEDRDRLFDSFFRSRRTRGHGVPGQGLGLAIGRAIVEAHHGSIRLVPTTDPGTRVVVRLPAWRP
jgi:signal transduction histidine kinase